MKVSSIAILLSAIHAASGFTPSSLPAFSVAGRTSSTALAAAATHEEDLELTRKVVLDYIESTGSDSGGVVDDDEDGSAETAAADAPPKAEKKQKKKKKSPPPQPAVEIDVSRLNVLVGVINKVWEHETADKLYCEEIDVGEGEPRQIASGLRAHYSAEDLEGRRVCVLANLKSRKLMGFPSHGMVLCASTDDGSKVVFVDPPEDASIGERVMVSGFDGEPATENQVIKKKMLDAIFPDLRTDSEGVASYKGVPLTAGTGKCVAEGALSDAQVS